eukprot:scaffold299808_cov38-Prasinocladus_malaysianus.AAC.1
MVAQRLPSMKNCLARSPVAKAGRSCMLRGTWNNELGWSLYDEQLARWFKAFPRESFLIIEKDNWAANLKETIQHVAGHFGLKAERLDRVKDGMRLDHGSIGKN